MLQHPTRPARARTWLFAVASVLIVGRAVSGGTIDIDGLDPTAAPGDGTTTIPLSGVVPGSLHVFTYAPWTTSTPRAAAGTSSAIAGI